MGRRTVVAVLEDVEAKAAEILNGSSKFQHYMGALILAPIGESAQIGVTPSPVQIVDGQQRLTTFQLFLAALREVARTSGHVDIVSHVADYLFNPLKSKDTDPQTRYKLTPTPSDRDIFHTIMDKSFADVRLKYQRYYWGGVVPKNTSFPALRAYDLFKRLIEGFVKGGPSDQEPDTDEELVEDLPEEAIAGERLEALLTGVLSRMKLVVITLGETDDAQVIFETLNSKGQPLLAMDLVRNNIFHRAEKAGGHGRPVHRAVGPVR